VTLRFASGRHKTFRLIGDIDIRDYIQNQWTNDIDGTTTQQWWGGEDPTALRLDVQRYNLGTRFIGDTLRKITVTAPADTDANVLQPVLFAIGIDAGGLTSVRAKCSAA
jgi:hypothetical protein